MKYYFSLNKIISKIEIPDLIGLNEDDKLYLTELWNENNEQIGYIKYNFYEKTVINELLFYKAQLIIFIKKEDITISFSYPIKNTKIDHITKDNFLESTYSNNNKKYDLKIDHFIYNNEKNEISNKDLHEDNLGLGSSITLLEK